MINVYYMWYLQNDLLLEPKTFSARNMLNMAAVFMSGNILVFVV